VQPRPQTCPPAGLATLLRDGSHADHRAAEQQPFVRALLAGRVSAAAYLRFLSRLAVVYDALETTAHALREDVLAGWVVDAALDRSAALRSDLRCWWRIAGCDARLDLDQHRERTLEASPATAAYVDRIAASARWGGLFVAHHYTRYLGDLSGGQAIGRVVDRTFALPGDEGLAFFHFPRVPKVKAYRDAYRARLDALPVDGDAAERILDEVKVAFALNAALFRELDPSG
jgi:heme oxygenase